MDPTWIALFAALAGAVVGGFASTYGSHLVTRADRIRDIRIEIYRHLLPRIHGHGLTHDWSDGPWGELVRAALTAGRRDARFSRQLWQLAQDVADRRALLAFGEDTETGAVDLVGPGEDEFPVAVQTAMDKASEYEDWLAEKLG